MTRARTWPPRVHDDAAGSDDAAPPARPERARRAPSLAALRKPAIVLAIAATWELWVRVAGVDPLLFPPLSDVLAAMARNFGFGGEPFLWRLTWLTLRTVLEAYGISIALALALTSVGIGNRWGRDLLSTVTGVFQPLPSIALLPMAILWFGLNRAALIFVVVMSMVWPLAATMATGFSTAPELLVRVAHNYELRGVALLGRVLLPLALPNIISGLRVAWGYGWRTVVAAELVFGATGASGGLGWFINNRRLSLETTDALGGILVVVVIGLAAETAFRLLQRATTQRWGMERA
ncbi:MAG TPA: ABC transporter permease [Actinomycetota bacterium]|nr:ABC transporter permease [Actinomycetota bacterium]